MALYSILQSDSQQVKKYIAITKFIDRVAEGVPGPPWFHPIQWFEVTLTKRGSCPLQLYNVISSGDLRWSLTVGLVSQYFTFIKLFYESALTL